MRQIDTINWHLHEVVYEIHMNSSIELYCRCVMETLLSTCSRQQTWHTLNENGALSTKIKQKSRFRNKSDCRPLAPRLGAEINSFARKLSAQTRVKLTAATADWSATWCHRWVTDDDMALRPPPLSPPAPPGWSRWQKTEHREPWLMSPRRCPVLWAGTAERWSDAELPVRWEPLVKSKR